MPCSNGIRLRITFNWFAGDTWVALGIRCGWIGCAYKIFSTESLDNNFFNPSRDILPPAIRPFSFQSIPSSSLRLPLTWSASRLFQSAILWIWLILVIVWIQSNLTIVWIRSSCFLYSIIAKDLILRRWLKDFIIFSFRYYDFAQRMMLCTTVQRSLQGPLGEVDINLPLYLSRQ